MAKKRKEKVHITPYKDSRPYVLWRRVSTKRQGESGLGLEAQLDIAKYFMQREPVKIFTDVYSGTKLRECKKLGEAIDYCHENDYVLVIAKTDRWRNVAEALWLLDEIGEGNLIFCDLPECNKYLLIQLCAMWERQADMISFNTERSLAVRKEQAEKDGGWFSRSGRWCTHLGNAKGADTSKASAVSAAKNAKEAYEWRIANDGYKWVRKQVIKGKKLKDILAEFNEFHDDGLQGFSTRNGCRMNICTLSKYIKEIRREL